MLLTPWTTLIPKIRPALGHPPAPTAGPRGWHTQPFSKGVPGPRRGHRPCLQGKLRQGWCQSRMPLPRGQILRYITHSQHLHSPVDMDTFFPWENKQRGL